MSLSILILLLLGGCASMNQSECLNANWKMIGLEDGARGRALSYVGNHRKACAKFNIKPELDAYQLGRDQGLRQYCTYSRGYRLGQRGYSLRNICPADLAQTFRLGHRRGLEIHSLNREITRTQVSIKKALADLQDLNDYDQQIEELLIAKDTKMLERVLLLKEVKETQTEIAQLNGEIDLLAQQKADIIYQRDKLSKEYQSEPGLLRPRN